MRARSTALLAFAVLLMPAHASAGREPVLKSLALPHSYYWRELYLPQLTSGPSSVAFAPDGDEVVYSMAGSLWRQRLDSSEAIELTHGPGYDYQPDWSPDGKTIVFARHHRDAIELVALQLERGRETALTRTGAVNVEPRLSPDGKRLAFVSTRDGGFDVWLADFDGTALRGERTLLPPHTSAVQRYYYAARDQRINPSWSPDGRALLLVDNRDVAWGTGDIWRVPLADPSQAQRLIREETSWAAQPELAPGGKRLLYASYQGRQWHQLWLASAQGESPMPLTFGDFDRREARWSPDGRRVAFIDNAGGNVALGIVDLDTGAQRRIEPRQRRYRRTMVDWPLAIRDPSGAALPARVQVLAADGRHCGPRDARLHADDGYDRERQGHEDHYFHCAGDCVVTVPRGRLTVRVQRGLEWQVLQREFVAGAEGQTVTLQPLDMPDTFGPSYSADLHVHMNYGGHYRLDAAMLAAEARAEALDVAVNLIVNKEQRLPDLDGFTLQPFRAEGVTILHGQEFHTSWWGHLGLVGLQQGLLLPDFAAYRHSGFASPYPHNGVIAQAARVQGAVVGYVHPYDWSIVPEREQSLTHQFPADVAHGRADYIELVSFSDPRFNEEVWHRLLNLGYRVPASAGTDAMTNYASLRGPVGLNRHVLPGEAGDAASLATAVREGRGFVTNAPLLGLRIDGRSAGDTVTLPAPGKRRFQASVRSIVPLDRAEILVNGRVAKVLKLRGGRSVDASGEIELPASGWVALRADARAAHPWIADLYPYGHTNPVWIEVAGVPPRSPGDGAYFVRWMDRVIDAAGARDDYDDTRQRDATLEYLREARAQFMQQAGGQSSGSNGESTP